MKKFFPLLLVFPFLFVFLIFLFFPLIFSLYLSFFKIEDFYNLFGSIRFVGFGNFVNLIKNPEVLWAIVASFIYGIFYVPILLTISLFLATLLSPPLLKLKKLFRTIYFFPFLLDTFVVGVVLTLILAFPYGYIYNLLSLLKISDFFKRGFLSDPYLVFLTVSISMAIKNSGFGMLLFLAGMQAIPGSLYEAARIDGASSFEIFRYITFPLIKPICYFVGFFGFISAFSSFSEFYSMTGGGPQIKLLGYSLSETNVSGLILYRLASQLRLTEAAAFSLILFAIFLFIYFSTKGFKGE
ncbi:MAG: sugar ABC transporter permease [Candidatus Hydrothermales bacterium]